MVVTVIRAWSDIDPDALAALGQAEALRAVNPAHVVGVIVAQRGRQILGWAILMAYGPGVVAINPGDFGGHPVISADEDAVFVTGEILYVVQQWAHSVNLRRVELWFLMTNDEDDQRYIAQYAALGFLERLRYVSMVRDVPATVPAVALPPGVTLESLRAVERDTLYAVYLAAFGAGDARFFAAQDEAERRAFFDTLGWESAPDHPASVVLRSGDQVAGFALVLPDGDGDHLISCMCIAPAFQGRGWGRLLLDVITARIAAQGGQRITLGTEPQMRAYGLYVRSGFRVVRGSIMVVWLPA